MPKTIQKELSKVNKLIHPKSRKMSKLAKQANRISSREKTKLVHHMKQNMIGEKLLWFRDHLQPDVARYTADQSRELIEMYLKRFEAELEQIALKHKVGNRKNRQHASREDIIKLTILQEEEEFATCGLEVPDLMNSAQLEMLRNWSGELRFLQNFKLQRYSQKKLGSTSQKPTDTMKERLSEENISCTEKVNKGNVDINNSAEASDKKDVMDIDVAEF